MKIKEKPEEFAVREKLNLKLGSGPYAYFLLKKTNWNTKSAVKALAERLHIREKDISYAGLKDKNAVTEQHIAILNGRKDYEKVRIKDIKLTYLGQGSAGLYTGQLEGNEFEIIAHDVEDAEPKEVMPNYFDDQRFGVKNTNALVGKALVHKDFKKACELLELDVEGNNYAGALQKHGKILKLYLHSYQSRLFNLILSEYIKKNYKNKEVKCGYENLAFPIENIKDDIKIPLISFDAEFEESLKETIANVLKQEGTTKDQFIIRQFPELVSQTTYRNGFVNISGLKVEDMGKNTKKLVFGLPKGSYATVALKAIFLQKI